jgi:hypothetical protein
MFTSVVQRWRNGRERYRPAGETIVTREYEISETQSDHLIREFLAHHHYLRSTPPARFRFCLYHSGQLVGAAVFTHPTNDLSVTKTFGCAAIEGVELSRLVLLDEVPANGESDFVGACLRHLRARGLAGVISFADPVARSTVDGRLVKPGHVGTVYQALNGCLIGRSTARTLRLLPDGSVLADRTIQKLRRGEPGTRAIRQALENLGISLPSGAVGSDLNTVLDRCTRSLRHSGNYKYAWGFSRAAAHHMPSPLPYPKLEPLFHFHS